MAEAEGLVLGAGDDQVVRGLEAQYYYLAGMVDIRGVAIENLRLHPE